MPSPAAQQIHAVMNRPEDIRLVSVIGHVGHGKTTLVHSLVRGAGGASADQAGDVRPAEGGPTVKSTSASVCFEFDEEEDGRGLRPHLVSLIDSPGRADFSSEVAAALRITDGALVLVDCVEGCALQTEMLLRRALTERVRPCLFVNKVDRCILELRMEPEDILCRLRRSIEEVNVVIASHRDELMGDIQVRPEKGTVAFGSALHGWGFTVEQFARIYAAKMGADKEKMTKRLWGDNFFNAKTKTWTHVMQPEGSAEPLRRAFCQFVLVPIAQLSRAIVDGDRARYEKMMRTLGIVLEGDDRSLAGRPLMARAMQLWIGAADALLAMIVTQLPSPRTAQRYRVESLYEGPMDDEAAGAMRACDAGGPLMMYVSKMVPMGDKGHFYAFGRVFSGTVAAGQRVRIQGPRYRVGGKEDLNVKSVQGAVLLTGRSAAEPVADVPCGNILALAGVDRYILKTGTITTLDDAHNIAELKHGVSPLVKVAVRPRDGKDLPGLVEGLKRLSKSDPLVACTLEESGGLVVAGSGELHLEACLRDLRQEFAAGCVFSVSDPFVPYRETVTERSSESCLVTSPNGHNRISLRAEPMPEELSREIESGRLGPRADAREREDTLRERFRWRDDHARRIWCWGPEMEGANVVVDATAAASGRHLDEIRGHVDGGFQWAAREGPLCEESMRGIRFNILDVRLHADAIHRGVGQIMPPVRRSCLAAEMAGRPTLQEPVLLVDVLCPQDAASGVRDCVGARRGRVFEEIPCEGTPLVRVKAHLPAAESLGLPSSLPARTSGTAFPQCVFDHWERMPGDAMEVGGKVEEVVLAVRKRKNLKVEMPPF